MDITYTKQGDAGGEWDHRIYERSGMPINSCVESFFASLKKELIYKKNYGTIEDVKADIFRYIELFYNRRQVC